MPTITDLLSIGAKHDQAGNLAEAERVYSTILHLDPTLAEAWRLHGRACLGQNKLEGAIRSFRQGLLLNPNSALAHNSLGIALARQRRWKDAALSFQQALALEPDYANAHTNLGNVLKEQGRIAEALVSYEAAVRLDPRSAVVHNNLGNALREAQRYEEAATSCAMATRLNPNWAEAHNNLANALENLGRFEEAIQCYHRALELRPDYAVAHTNLAIVLAQQGQTKDAADHLHEALRLQPDFALAYSCLGELAAQRQYRFTDSEIDQMQRLLTRADPTGRDAIGLHFTLARIADQRGDYDLAFSQFTKGNELRRRQLQQRGAAFDIIRHRAWVDRIIRTYDAAFLRKLTAYGVGSELPLFIVGMPRSGTTLVEQILASHPEVVGAGELADIDCLATALSGEFRTLGELNTPHTGERIHALAAGYLHKIQSLAAGAQRVTDKMPENYLHLGIIAALFAQSRIIHCQREPLDVCLSCFMQDFQQMPFSCSLEDLTAYYEQYERLMAHWQRVLPQARLHHVCYEELVLNPETISRQLVAAAGLDWHDRCLAFFEQSRGIQTASKLQVRQPIYTRSIGRWKKYASHLDALRMAFGTKNR
jgi:tetratricopeptide (TPR) repeat protein